MLHTLENDPENAVMMRNDLENDLETPVRANLGKSNCTPTDDSHSKGVVQHHAYN